MAMVSEYLLLGTEAGFLSRWRSTCVLTSRGGPAPCSWRQPSWPGRSGARGEGALALRLQCPVQDWQVSSGVTQFAGIWTLILDNKGCLQCFWAGQTQWATCHCNPEFSEWWRQIPAHAVCVSDSTRWEKPRNVTSTCITRNLFFVFRRKGRETDLWNT